MMASEAVQHSVDIISPGDRQLLAHSPLAAGLESGMLKRLETMARLKTGKRGEFLFFPGDQACFFYFVLEGKIKLFHVDEKGRECIIRVAGSNNILCLTTVFSHQTYKAVGETLSQCRFLAFPGDSFMELMKKDAVLTGNVLRILSLRIEHIYRKQCLSRNLPAPAQVAHYLMERSSVCNDCRCCPLDLRPLQVTAQEIGIARETLSRIIGQMKKDGIIDCCRGCVTIRNRELIEDAAYCLRCEKRQKTSFLKKNLKM